MMIGVVAVVLLSGLVEAVPASSDTDKGREHVLVDSKLLERLVGSLELKNEQINELVERLEKLETRGDNLGKENDRLIEMLALKNGQIDDLVQRVEKLESRDDDLNLENYDLIRRLTKLESDQDIDVDTGLLQDRVTMLENREADLENENAKLKFIVEDIAAREDNDDEETRNNVMLERNGANVQDNLTSKGASRVNSYGYGGKRSNYQKRQSLSSSGNSEPYVAFFARVSADLENVANGATVIFDSVFTNIGNAYSRHTGVFHAPLSGTYVFSTTLMTHENYTTRFYFKRNDVKLSWMYVRGTESPHSSASQTVVLELERGDQVSLHNDVDGITVNGNNYCVFSGFLLYESEPPMIIG